jgi:ABC-type glutathione transport system ATPase component
MTSGRPGGASPVGEGARPTAGQPLSAGVPGIGAEEVVALRGVSKVYRSRGGTVEALREVTLAFAAGSFTTVMGPSCSGKSALLQYLAGLDRPTSGEIRAARQDLGWLSEIRLTAFHRGTEQKGGTLVTTRSLWLASGVDTGARR